MTADEVLDRVATAFSGADRPERFTVCLCEECVELNARLQAAPELPDGIAWDLPLLSAEGFRFLLPELVRAAIAKQDDDLAWELIRSLAQPISKSDPPHFLPHTRLFNREQSAATLAFLEFVKEASIAAEADVSGELDRGIQNWRFFLSHFRHAPE